MSEINAPHPSDLPSRTWRQWWLAWPKWFRIGCGALAAVMLLQIAVAIRLYVGLLESPGITELRRRRVVVEYVWQEPGSTHWLPLSYKQRDYLYGGLYGKTWGNIIAIEASRLTPAELRTIRQKCRSLRVLTLHAANLSPELLEELAQCRQLRALCLPRAELNDETLSSLDGLKSLRYLDLRETLFSDEDLPALETLPLLSAVDLGWTDVTQSALIDWKYRRQKFKLSAEGRSDESLATETYASIRWSDGTRSPGFPGGVNYRWDWERANGEPYRKTSASGMERRQLIFNSDSFGDGVHTLRLRIGGYDAEPVTIVRDNGKTSTPWVEFRMPCTRGEALRRPNQ